MDCADLGSKVLRISTLACLSDSLAFIATVSPASAIIILDSTWAEAGGVEGSEADGFAAHEELAQEPQFSATIKVEDADSSASGIWIGNDAEHGYVLTAGHALGPDEEWEADHPDELDAIDFTDMPDNLEVVTDDGTAYPVSEIRRHPWFDHYANLAGTDMAVLITDPIEGLGEQPSLYCGEDEGGQTVTFVGYGTRGIGSVGADPDPEPQDAGSDPRADEPQQTAAREAASVRHRQATSAEVSLLSGSLRALTASDNFFLSASVRSVYDG